MDKGTVSSKLEARIAEAAAEYAAAAGWAYFARLRQGADDYYSDTEEVSKSFSKMLEGLYCKLQRERVIFSGDEELGIAHDLSVPAIADVFYKWAWLDRPLEIVMEPDALTGEEIPAAAQPALDAIIAEMAAAREKEAAALADANEAYWQDGDELKKLVEDRGGAESAPRKEEIARLMYIDAGARKLIEDNGLDVYIPRCAC